MTLILEKMIYENYILGVDIDTLYLNLLDETLKTRGKNLYNTKLIFNSNLSYFYLCKNKTFGRILQDLTCLS